MFKLQSNQKLKTLFSLRTYAACLFCYVFAIQKRTKRNWNEFSSNALSVSSLSLSICLSLCPHLCLSLCSSLFFRNWKRANFNATADAGHQISVPRRKVCNIRPKKKNIFSWNIFGNAHRGQKCREQHFKNSTKNQKGERRRSYIAIAIASCCLCFDTNWFIKFTNAWQKPPWLDLTDSSSWNGMM